MRRPSPQELARRWLVLAAVVALVAGLATWRITSPRAAPEHPVQEAGDDPAATNGAAGDAPGTAGDDGRPEPTTLESTGVMLADPGSDGPVVGDGTIHTYRVEVEGGTGVEPAEFAAHVERILSDPRGWTAADGIALQRVTDPDRAEILITLATPDLVDVMCLPMETDGEVSCAHTGHAILNARRWHHGAEPSGLGLDDYRAYLVSHEVGHTLGHSHVECPGPGALAPVMLQQTLGIGDCHPNPWPAPETRTG